MSNNLAGQFSADPATLSAQALAAPRCVCLNPMRIDEGFGPECARCGREVRAAGECARLWRLAAYERQLRWGRGAGLDPMTGFRGVAAETGPNPPVEVLHASLEERLRASRST